MDAVDKLTRAGYLPVASGLLPYWLLLTSAASIYNAAQNYFILWQTKEIYSLKPYEGTWERLKPAELVCRPKPR